MLNLKFALQVEPVCCKCENPIAETDHAVFLAEAEGRPSVAALHVWCAQEVRSTISEVEEKAGAVIAEMYKRLL